MARRPPGERPGRHQRRNDGGEDRTRHDRGGDQRDPEQTSPQTLGDRFAELVRAAFPGVLVVTGEPDEAVRELSAACTVSGWNFGVWLADGGADAAGGPADPLEAVKALRGRGDGDTPAVLAMVHAHRFFQSAELLAAVRTTLAAGKTLRTCLALVQPAADLPPELARDFAVLEHPLPSREELDAVARGVATEPGERRRSYGRCWTPPPG